MAVARMLSLSEIDYSVLTRIKQKNFQLASYEPQDSQALVHASHCRLLVISGGEGSGKSITTAMEIFARYPFWSKVLLVAYKHEAAHKEADYLYDALKQVKAVQAYSAPRRGPIELITKSGSHVESISTEKEGPRAVSGTGESYDIIAMTEAGKQSYDVFLACVLRISRTGGLLIVSGTIEQSEPWFPDLIRRLENKQTAKEMDAEVIIIPTWENRALYPLGIADPKIQILKRDLSEELFEERLAGKPIKSAALVFKRFGFDTHVFDWVKFDENEPVEIWIDPGYSGSHYAVLFVQFHPRSYTRQFHDRLPDVSLTDVWVFDELYLDHAEHEEVILQCQQKPCWTKVRTAVGDVAMQSHPLAGKRPSQVWQEKTALMVRGQLVSPIQVGINRHQTFIRDAASGYPRIFFNAACKGALGEYGKWKRKKVGAGLYGEPENKWCDALKAINYGLIDHFGVVETDKKQEVRDRENDYDKAATALIRALESE